MGTMTFLDPGCASVRRHLEEFALDTLEKSERGPIERHLQRCARCRAHEREWREIASLMPRGLDAVDPAPEVLADLLSRVREPRRRRGTFAASLSGALAAGVAAVALLAIAPSEARLADWGLASPEVVVINLFVCLDAPLHARYEYRTEEQLRFDESVGRILYNVSNGEWKLVVHGLPRPPRGSRYVLTVGMDERELELGTLERWEEGVALLSGRTDTDLTQTERLSLELVSPGSRLRLLDAAEGAW